MPIQTENGLESDAYISKLWQTRRPFEVSFIKGYVIS